VWPVGRVVEVLKSYCGYYEVCLPGGHFHLVSPDHIKPAAAPRTALERLLAGDGPLGGGSPQTGSTGQP